MSGVRKSVVFLSLSGVRVHEPELRALGMTLPGFIERGNTIARLPSLGLLTLAALTPPDWEIAYHEMDAWDDNYVAQLCESPCGIVALSALTARIKDAYRLSDILRAAGKRVVLGGLHVSALPDEAALHADAVIVGEGEPAWPRVLQDFASGEWCSVYRSDSYDLAQAPLPRYDLLDPTGYNRLTLQTTRGCPLDCEFCAASRTISRYKRKPLELVQRDLEAILSLWPRPFIELADDNTFVHKEWGRQLATLLGRYPVRWFTETDISVADDEHLLDLLADSGCAQLLIGLESAVPQSLRGMDSRDWKLRQQDVYIEKIGRVQSRGISVNGCFTLGLDGDDESVFETTRDFVRACGLAEVQITVMTPFPGTALYHRLQQEGRLLTPGAWERCTLFDVMYRPRRMNVRALEQGFAWLMKELYNDESTRWRKSHFRQVIRQRAQGRIQKTE